MMKESGQASHTKSGGGPPLDLDFEALVAKLSAKDRHSVDRQVLARETSSVFGLADRWRRLASMLMTLAPGIVKLCGVHTMQFYIADGKYRKQVFALHALADGALVVCVPDILEDAASAGFIRAETNPDSSISYCLVGSDETLAIDIVDGKTLDPQIFYKDMTGWNRRAIYITLPAQATRSQIRAVEDLCKLAAVGWNSGASTAIPETAVAALKAFRAHV